MLELVQQYNVLGAFWVTIQLTFWSAIGSVLIGTIVVIMRISPAQSLQWAGATFVNVVRNTPLTLIVLGASLGLWGQLGVVLARQGTGEFIATNNFRLAVLALSVYHAAFVAEALRSGVNTVPLGQAEAARSIGLGFGQSVGLVIMPQAFRGAIAPLGNTLIALIKNTTVAQAAGVAQASTIMATMIEFNANMLTAIFMLFAIGFVIIVLPTGMLATYLSRKLRVAR